MNVKDGRLILFLQQLATKFPHIERIWLFGSRAKGTEHEHSDYDIAVAWHDCRLGKQRQLFCASLNHIEF